MSRIDDIIRPLQDALRMAENARDDLDRWADGMYQASGGPVGMSDTLEQLINEAYHQARMASSASADLQAHCSRLQVDPRHSPP